MSTLGAQPAFPTSSMTGHPGMSTRTWLAGMALGGLLANPNLVKSAMTGETDPRKLAVEYADALLAELEKP